MGAVGALRQTVVDGMSGLTLTLTLTFPLTMALTPTYNSHSHYLHPHRDVRDPVRPNVQRLPAPDSVSFFPHISVLNSMGQLGGDHPSPSLSPCLDLHPHPHPVYTLTLTLTPLLSPQDGKDLPHIYVRRQRYLKVSTNPAPPHPHSDRMIPILILILT